jgi:hypothetical protein
VAHGQCDEVIVRALPGTAPSDQRRDQAALFDPQVRAGARRELRCPSMHWISFFRDKDVSYYFDSYGIIPFREAVNFLDTKERYYSSFQIQQPNTKLCGELSLYVLYKLSKGFDFFDIVLEMNNYFNKNV